MAEKYKAQQMIDAIVKHKGILAAAARELKCSRTTVYTYIKKYPTIKHAYIEANETNKDFVEGKLMQSIDGGNVTAMIFFLKTKARDRGYVERYGLDANINVASTPAAVKALQEAQKKLNE